VLPIGTKGTLLIAGLTVALPWVARATAGDDLHLEFAPDDAGRAALRSLLERLAGRLAA
jgi:hypothetical protein